MIETINLYICLFEVIYVKMDVIAQILKIPFMVVTKSAPWTVQAA